MKWRRNKETPVGGSFRKVVFLCGALIYAFIELETMTQATTNNTYLFSLPIRWQLYSANKSASFRSKAIAMASMLSTEIFRSPRSTEPMYVRCSPH